MYLVNRMAKFNKKTIDFIANLREIKSKEKNIVKFINKPVIITFD